MSESLGSPGWRPRVVLLHDAVAAEGRIDTGDVLAEAAHVASALETLGCRAFVEPVGPDLGAVERLLERRAPDVVFNLMESLAGRAELIHVVPCLLEAIGLPFTGNPAAAQWSTSNKLLAKERLAEAGIETPGRWREAVPGETPVGLAREGRDTVPGRRPDSEPGEGPWIVKSVWEHASLGIEDDSVVAAASDVAAMIERRRAEWGGDWFAERFVGGRELNVALIAAPDGVRALPVAEILFSSFPEGKPRIVGYAAKWDDASFEHEATPRTFDVEPALCARASAAARACWACFGLEGYARVDFRVDAEGRLFVLEVNANPCLSPDAGFAAALDVAGIAFTDAVAWLLDDAFRRRPSAGSAAPLGARARRCAAAS